MSKECDNFGEFFVYRLENLLTKNLKKDSNRNLVSRLIKRNEDIIKKEFNFYLNAKSKNTPQTNKSKLWTYILESWRPVMMYLFMYIIGQYYIVNPIIEFTWPSIKLKNLPPEMWTLLTVAVGGYITSRGVEKGIKLWKGNETPQVILAENFDRTGQTTTENDDYLDAEGFDENPKEEDLA